ncbi:hypothetical protein RGQ29_032192 [Quercus rubra]|uniref:Auxiliary Activity family 9 catalytic domain-containing protein n=1 Tax=Quercus rubra TaxID=3512 RepID=A0AAN7DSX8_QUERU|nr:hypothetical protein RGQ29_032192 [Quercus rubra]
MRIDRQDCGSPSKQFAKISALQRSPCLPSVSAHGYVSGIVSGGKYYSGQSPNWYYQVQNKQPVPPNAGWQALNQDNGFVAPSAYGTQDISCHKSATTGKSFVPVTAGSTIQLQWTAWPESHHGPLINYLAPCPGDCTAITSADLKFFKFQADGLIDDTTVPGNWASDKMIANNNTATVTIPKNVKNGGYVLRHEIIALHGAESAGGAQNYPQCINIKVTGGTGTTEPAGTAGPSLYTQTENGIVFNIYQTITSYPIPGPKIATLTKKMHARSSGQSETVRSAKSKIGQIVHGQTSASQDVVYSWPQYAIRGSLSDLPLRNWRLWFVMLT